MNYSPSKCCDGAPRQQVPFLSSAGSAVPFLNLMSEQTQETAVEVPTAATGLAQRTRLSLWGQNSFSTASQRTRVMEKPGRVLLRMVCQEAGHTEPNRVRDSGQEC